MEGLEKKLVSALAADQPGGGGGSTETWERFSGWVHSICVVTFDLELGQVYTQHLDYQYVVLNASPQPKSITHIIPNYDISVVGFWLSGVFANTTNLTEMNHIPLESA